MFEQMRDNYGVNIPDINIVIGENNGGERVVFMVVDKIAGENLNNPVILNNFVDVENYKTLACFAETQGLKVLSLFMEAVILHRG